VEPKYAGCVSAMYVSEKIINRGIEKKFLTNVLLDVINFAIIYEQNRFLFADK
jgi:hypothetical protein